MRVGPMERRVRILAWLKRYPKPEWAPVEDLPHIGGVQRHTVMEDIRKLGADGFAELQLSKGQKKLEKARLTKKGWDQANIARAAIAVVAKQAVPR